MEMKGFVRVEITLEKGIGLEESWLTIKACSKVITITQVLLTQDLTNREKEKNRIQHRTYPHEDI